MANRAAHLQDNAAQHSTSSVVLIATLGVPSRGGCLALPRKAVLWQNNAPSA